MKIFVALGVWFNSTDFFGLTELKHGLHKVLFPSPQAKWRRCAHFRLAALST